MQLFTPTALEAPPYVDVFVLPPAVHAPVITYDPTDRMISAWYPGGDSAKLELNKTGSSSDSEDIYETFANKFCEDCKYYFDTDESEDTDSDGNDTETITTSKCPAHRDSLRNLFRCEEECAQGHYLSDADDGNKDGEWADITLPPMLFEYDMQGEQLKAGMCYWQLQDDVFMATTPDGMLNIGSGMTDICWGEGNSDVEFSATIGTFINSAFNEDLLNHDRFLDKASNLSRLAMRRGSATELLLRTPDNPCDALLLINSKGLGPGGLQLIASGINPDALPGKALPLMRHTHQGINGFITPPLPTSNRCWFISIATFQLLGQIPCPVPAEPAPSLPTPC